MNEREAEDKALQLFGQKPLDTLSVVTPLWPMQERAFRAGFRAGQEREAENARALITKGWNAALKAIGTHTSDCGSAYWTVDGLRQLLADLHDGNAPPPRPKQGPLHQTIENALETRLRALSEAQAVDSSSIASLTNRSVEHGDRIEALEDWQQKRLDWEGGWMVRIEALENRTHTPEWASELTGRVSALESKAVDGIEHSKLMNRVSALEKLSKEEPEPFPRNTKYGALAARVESLETLSEPSARAELNHAGVIGRLDALEVNAEEHVNCINGQARRISALEGEGLSPAAEVLGKRIDALEAMLKTLNKLVLANQR
jgi:hypothetical protein